MVPALAGGRETLDVGVRVQRTLRAVPILAGAERRQSLGDVRRKALWSQGSRRRLSWSPQSCRRAHAGDRYALYPLRGVAAIARDSRGPCGRGSRPHHRDGCENRGAVVAPPAEARPRHCCAQLHRHRGHALSIAVGPGAPGATEHRGRLGREQLAPMPSGFGLLSTIAMQFALLSLFAIGGATTAVPEIHRQAVELHHWMTDRQFSELFAISQAAPGPNVMIVTLIG